MSNDQKEREQPHFYHYWIDEKVRFHDLDAYNHVNNNVIGIYFETARMAWLEDVHPKGWLTGAHFVLAKNTITFLRELNYPNQVRIGQRILNLGNSSMTSCGGIFVNNTCVALAETVSVWIGSKTRRPEAISDSVRHALSRYS
jgi:acyl-CoA thioester hydrolase